MAKKKVQATVSVPSTVRGDKRVQTPVRLTEELIERIKNMLAWAPQGHNFQSFAEEALTVAITRDEKERNGGKPWPQRPERAQ